MAVFALSNKWVSNIDDWYKDMINRLKTGSYVPLSFNSSAFTNSIINAIGVATVTQNIVHKIYII